MLSNIEFRFEFRFPEGEFETEFETELALLARRAFIHSKQANACEAAGEE